MMAEKYKYEILKLDKIPLQLASFQIMPNQDLARCIQLEDMV